MKKLLLVAGARPNFMKIAPILRALKGHRSFCPIVVHTGQHYDNNMSASFLSALEIGEPKYNLSVGSASHAVQTATIMIEFEKVVLDERPDLVIVVGDVNSTIAAGLVAKKLRIPLAHVEAGLRSKDHSMPEEINRIATDAIADVLFTTEEEATRNLVAEGHHPAQIHFVGHVMIDNLLHQLEKLKNKGPSKHSAGIRTMLPKKYTCLTMHRPSNVDNRQVCTRLVGAIHALAQRAPVIFPCHPRTLKQINAFGLRRYFKDIPTQPKERIDNGLYLVEPLDYNDFLFLWKDATLVLTDSGGLQEETTALRIPCITMRENTERPVTVEIGSNVVAGTDANRIVQLGERALAGHWKNSNIPTLWDGRASERIIKVLERMP